MNSTCAPDKHSLNILRTCRTSDDTLCHTTKWRRGDAKTRRKNGRWWHIYVATKSTHKNTLTIHSSNTQKAHWRFVLQFFFLLFFFSSFFFFFYLFFFFLFLKLCFLFSFFFFFFIVLRSCFSLHVFHNSFSCYGWSWCSTNKVRAVEIVSVVSPWVEVRCFRKCPGMLSTPTPPNLLFIICLLVFCVFAIFSLFNFQSLQVSCYFTQMCLRNVYVHRRLRAQNRTPLWPQCKWVQFAYVKHKVPCLATIDCMLVAPAVACGGHISNTPLKHVSVASGASFFLRIFFKGWNSPNEGAPSWDYYTQIVSLWGSTIVHQVFSSNMLKPIDIHSIVRFIAFLLTAIASLCCLLAVETTVAPQQSIPAGFFLASYCGIPWRLATFSTVTYSPPKKHTSLLHDPIHRT